MAQNLSVPQILYTFIYLTVSNLTRWAFQSNESGREFNSRPPRGRSATL